MGVALVTPPDVEPITLDEALAHCRITADTEDGLVAGYIMAARTYAENVTRRALIKRTFDYTVDFQWPYIRQEATTPLYPYYYWRQRLELPRTPVISVTSVQYIDSNGSVQTLDPSLYMVLLNEAVPYIEPVFGTNFPTVQYQPAAIMVRFDAGYGESPGDVPNNLRQAMLLLVAYWYDNRGSEQFGGRASSGDVTSTLMPAEIPPGVSALLSQDAIMRIL
jgi:uncharacterized phiE125 gp8 family phage protein